MNKEKPVPTYAIPSPAAVSPSVLAQSNATPPSTRPPGYTVPPPNVGNPAGFDDPAPIVVKPSGVSPYERSGINKIKPIPHYAEPPLLKDIVAAGSLAQNRPMRNHHRHNRNYGADISERQIDEEVHGFANPNTETLNWARSEDPFIMNGSKNPASGYGYVDPDAAASLLQNRHHRNRRDISEK